MKTRTSLVSNSSTSSFIVLYKSPEKCMSCGRGPTTIKDQLEYLCLHDSDCEIYADTVSGVKQKLIDKQIPIDERKKIIEQLDCISSTEWNVIYFSISYHNIAMLEEVQSLEDSGSKILYRGTD